MPNNLSCVNLIGLLHFWKVNYSVEGIQVRFNRGKVAKRWQKMSIFQKWTSRIFIHGRKSLTVWHGSAKFKRKFKFFLLLWIVPQMQLCLPGAAFRSYTPILKPTSRFLLMKKCIMGLFPKNRELQIEFLTRNIDCTLIKPCPLSLYGFINYI